MARKRIIKELTPAQSVKMVKKLITEKRRINKDDWKPGNIIFTHYLAKYMSRVYDRTPLVLILKRNKTHTLGLAFHWIPFNKRLMLIDFIMKLNKENIAKNRPLQFSYAQVKPMLKSLGYAPCIRLYINHRFKTNGTVVPPDRLLEIARLRTETFTRGKYTASDMFRMAREAGKRKLQAKRAQKAARSKK